MEKLSMGFSKGSYNICLYALGQSNCKPVSFTVGVNNIAPVKTPVNIRNAKERGVFILDNKSGKQLKIEIYNLMGQMIKSFSCVSKVQTFNLLQQMSGIYVAKITANDSSFQNSIKIVNER